MHRAISKAKKINIMIKYWIRTVRGEDYWHEYQGLGRVFDPTEIRGYFNDMTGKTNWLGNEDANNIPISKFNGKELYFPTTIIQKALGHWDLYLISQNDFDRNLHLGHVKSTAKWLIDNQDDNGGWILWPLIGRKYKSPYSGMSQGQAISLLVRIYSLTKNDMYLISAKRALKLLLTNLDEGGVQRNVKNKIILEEAPTEGTSGILNGWVFALFGVYDFINFYGSTEEKKILDSLVIDLIDSISEFDTKFWSYYDLEKNYASPFYNNLHVAQLLAMEHTFLEHKKTIALYREKFEKYSNRPLNKMFAIIVKIIQKIRNPPDGVLQ